MNLIGNTAVRRAAWLGPTLLVGLAQAAPGAAVKAGPEADALAAASPEAAALVARAEGAARGGRVEESWGLFGQAWSLAPRSPLPPRGICRLALGLGIRTPAQQSAARSACNNALMLGGTPEDMRNKVAAWVGGDLAPTMEDLVAASFAADGAARTGPSEPWGARARVDLALRLGDRDLLDAAVLELRRALPDHEQTKQALALSAERASRWIWAGRLAVALAALLTAAHALARRWSRRQRRVPRPLVATVAVLVLLTSEAAAAAAPSIDDAHPERSVPTPAQQLADPMAFADLLTDLGMRAEAAKARKDHVAAARYYLALATAVPDRPYAYTKLCESLEAVGEREQALAACRTAITRQGTTAGDYTTFVRVLLAKKGFLEEDERRQVGVAIAALETEPSADLIATRVRCNVAAHEHDLPALETCTAKLVAAAPGDERTVAFQRAVAIGKRGWSVAGPSSGRLARGVRWAAVGTLSFLAFVFLCRAAARGRGRFRRWTASQRAGRSHA